ncbi:hypothetical protein [Natronoglycomyces albus]|uniref:Uncharacterized protein n=1 Tax=Natronoglycomyces albus TaxID=2811108 RepID=A0A895XGZ6_9ACTN|nr:hypothetical protein [Natronoglycomyces albus]QSB05121.1 hypothetical protein JQS30_15390 [Natronoglycomyces albus]
MKAKRWLQAALISVTALGVMGAVTPAAAEQLLVSGSVDGAVSLQSADGYSETYGNKRGVRVCDTSWDGWDVYSNFYVRNDSVRKRIETTGGKGSCAESGLYEAGIDRHNTCLNRTLLPDSCTDYRKVPW